MIYSIYLNIIVKVFILGVHILTGSIGSGKSEAQKIFEKFNYSCFCADNIVKTLYSEDEIILGIKKIIPNSVENGVINKKLLREVLFSNESKMCQVENYIQPKVFLEFEKILDSNINNNIILVIPIIKNISLNKKYKVIYISSYKENRINRLRTRNNYSLNIIENIINYQEKIDIYKNNNSYFLENNGSIEDLEDSIKNIIKLI
mgnify:CR=1 FL=1